MLNNTQKKSPAAPANQAPQNDNHKPGNIESPIRKLMPRLYKVKKTGRGQYLARCPAHDDSSPSLSIKEVSDGTLLIKCWAGCEALEIVHGVGLELRDLFPSGCARRPKSRHERHFNPRDILDALAYELTVITTIASDIKERKECDSQTFARLAIAVKRFNNALGAIQ